MTEEANKIFVGGVYWDAEKIEELIRNHTNQNVEAAKSLRGSLFLIHKLEAENKKLREALSKDNLLEIIEEWQMIWRNQKINPEDTKRYRRRALSVDANMRGSLARMISKKALSSGEE